MVAPYIDPALDVLRNQIKAQHPGVVIYWIGDPAHATRKSDHNPEADGSVDAIDIMVGPHFSKAQAQTLVNVLVRVRDWRLSYIIWNGHIWNPTQGWRVYTGTDKHTDHIHISRNDSQEHNKERWVISAAPRKVMMIEFNVKVPILQEGDDDNTRDGYDMIRRIQRQCGFTGKDVDGVWGPATTAAIKRTANVQNGSKLTEDIYRRLFGLTK